MLKDYRKQNITGIKHLSVSLSTKNGRGVITKRYIVNYKDDDGKTRSKSFYFGKNTDIFDAFIKACLFMIENSIIDLTIEECKEIFEKYEHEGNFA